MKIVVDENMPYVEPLFGALGEIIPVCRTLIWGVRRDNSS